MQAPSPRAARPWPISSAGFAGLTAELDRLVGDVADARAPGVSAGSVLRLPVRDAGTRLGALRGVFVSALATDDPIIAAIGRRVTLRDADGATWDVALVLPGDGDPERGWVSADAPLGRAVLGARADDDVVVVAPGGAWTAKIVQVA